MCNRVMLSSGLTPSHIHFISMLQTSSFRCCCCWYPTLICLRHLKVNQVTWLESGLSIQNKAKTGKHISKVFVSKHRHCNTNLNVLLLMKHLGTGNLTVFFYGSDLASANRTNIVKHSENYTTICTAVTLWFAELFAMHQDFCANWIRQLGKVKWNRLLLTLAPIFGKCFDLARKTKSS